MKKQVPQIDDSCLNQKPPGDNENFSLNFSGKASAYEAAQLATSSKITDENGGDANLNFGDNLFIEGDNLDALKLLQNKYTGKIKMIYIDPPYNTGNLHFLFNDQFPEAEIKILKKGVPANAQLSGKFHSAWLSMMLPRLFVARNLLTDDGVIFISIDENEVHNLKLLMNELYGEDNFVNTLVVKRRIKSLNTQFKQVRNLNQGFEYILIYRKSGAFYFPSPVKEANEQRKEGYWNSFWNNADRPTMRYEIAGINISKGQWKWEKIRAYRALENYHEFLKIAEKEKIQLRDYWLREKDAFNEKHTCKMEFIMPTATTVKYWVSPSETTISDTNFMEYYVNDDTGKRKYFFDTVKNLELITKLIETATFKDSIILDFFAGTGTTAEAVLQANKKDQGARKFICIQMAEECKPKSEAFKAGFKTISEITKTRIKMAMNNYSNLFEHSDGCQFVKIALEDTVPKTR